MNTNIFAPASTDAVYDENLRRYMLGVYNYMGLGVALTGIVAFIFSQIPQFVALLATPFAWVIMLAPLAMVFVISFGINRFSPQTLRILFWVYCGLMGASLSTIFIVFTGESIARTFFITAAAFGGLSYFGYTTKRDLTAFGHFLIIGLFGLIIAMVVNIFLASSVLQLVVSILGVLIFAGLTAWDTQRIKNEFSENYGRQTLEKMVVVNSLSLYLNFINLFMFLLQFLGQQSD